MVVLQTRSWLLQEDPTELSFKIVFLCPAWLNQVHLLLQTAFTHRLDQPPTVFITALTCSIDRLLVHSCLIFYNVWDYNYILSPVQRRALVSTMNVWCPDESSHPWGTAGNTQRFGLTFNIHVRVDKSHHCIPIGHVLHSTCNNSACLSHVQDVKYWR